MRLIDADTLGVGYANRSVFENSAYADGWNAAIEILKNAPTIEIERPTKAQFKRMTVQLGYEQVVCCKDCKYSYEDISDRTCVYGPPVDCIVQDNFYCANGKRREGADQE